MNSNWLLGKEGKGNLLRYTPLLVQSLSDLLTNSIKQTYIKHLLLLAPYYLQGSVISYKVVACDVVGDSSIYTHIIIIRMAEYLLSLAVTSSKDMKSVCHVSGENHFGASN